MTLKRAVGGFLVVLLVAVSVAAVWQRGDSGPLYIGVMLPLSGHDDVGWRQPLEWALEAVNDAGGVDGRPLALRYVDIAIEDPFAAAERLAVDDSVLAVIGPDKSGLLFELAPLFLEAKKPLVSPSSTSGDVTRAFAGSRFVWRTVESDIGQLRAMFLLADRQGVSDVALITSFDAYGSTFFDWFGFFATELGMTVTRIQRLNDNVDCADPMEQLLASGPQLVIAVPSQRSTALCIATHMRARPDVRLLFSDGGLFPALIEELGPQAEGLSGMALAADPTSGFAEAYEDRFGAPPVAYAANTYDALLLLAFGLTRSGGEGEDALADAIIEITAGEGTRTTWDHAGVDAALEMIRRGELPDISGATGELDFGDRDQIDLRSSYYAYWRVEDAAFRYTEFISTDPRAHSDSETATAVIRNLASEQRKMQVAVATAPAAPLERTGVWALLVATSSGWENYRHQADVLAQYQLLKEAGVPDDRIILIVADDLALAPENTEPGVVRHALGGPNIYEAPEIDYDLGELEAADILAILAGHTSDRLPTVIESTAGDNIYMFISGHGGGDGFFVGVDRAAESVDEGSFVSPGDFARTVEEMAAAGRYRRALFVFEMCHAGIMGTELTAPGALVMTGANAHENSLATNYAADRDAWLGNEFTVALTNFALRNPDATLGMLYQNVYLRVPGSHVSVYNVGNFGSLDAISLSEFITP